MAYRKPYRIKKKKSPLKNRWFWWLILASILAGEIFYSLLFLETFQIEEITIFGNNKVKTESIKALVPSRGSIFLVNASKVAQTISKAFPQIDGVRVQRILPNKLVINVAERAPVAVFCEAAGCSRVDIKAVLFEKDSGESNLPKIEGLAPSKDLLGKILWLGNKLDDLKISFDKIMIVSDDRLNVKISDGWEAYFAPKEDLNWQAIKLQAVLDKEIPLEGRKNLEYIDLRFGNHAPYKYR